jgi:hypothetical protein
MTLNLTAYPVIGTALFIRVETILPDATTEVVTFSDYHTSLTLAGVAYTGLGQFLSITETQTDIRATPAELTVGISGIPSENMAWIDDQDLKGSAISIQRGIFDPVTMELLDIPGNPAGRFIGYVTNYNITEDQDNASRSGSQTIFLICSSSISLLGNKLSGRATNPTAQRELYLADASFDRVPNITNANYNFGAP